MKSIRSVFIKGLISVFVIVAFVSVFRTLTLVIFSTAPDFSVLWMGARDLTRGFNPYTNVELFTGIGYPPNSLVFYLPFSFLSYQLAQALFTILSFIFSLGVILLSLKIFKEKFSWQTFFVVFSLTFLSFPTKFTLGMGQNNLIALFLLLLAYYFYKERNVGKAGFTLGLAISLKTVFIFFILFYLLKKEWQIIKFAVLTIIGTVLVVSIFFDINLFEYYLKEMIPPLLNLSGREIYYNQGVMGFISRLTTDSTTRKYIGLIVNLFLVIFVSWIAYYKNNKDLQFSLFIITLLLIDTLSWQHHFVWLIFPFVLLTNFVIRHRKIFYLVLITTSFLLVSWNFKNPLPYYGFPKSLMLSNTFYGLVILFFINAALVLKRDVLNLDKEK